MTKPYLIAICHQKGGVAKTTTVSALGAALVERGHPTLLIDLDPSANLSAGLGIYAPQKAKTAADILLGNTPFADLAQPTDLEGLDIIPSGADMVAAAKLLATRPQYENILKHDFLYQNLAYDYIILDCPPALDAITTAALSAANLALIPTQCEYFAIQAVNSMLKFIQRIRAEHNPQLHYRLLITMFDLRGKLHTQLYEKVQTYYHEALLNTVIGFDSKLRASQIAGQPITVFAPQTRASLQYRDLAQEIEAYVEKRRIS